MSAFKKKVSGLMVLEVCGGNPNGDPDEGNRPRTTPDSRGVISAMCQKRKIRDVLVDHDSPCFDEFAKELKLPSDNFQIYESQQRGWDDITPAEAAEKVRKLSESDPAAFLARYWDYRVFGGMLLEHSGKAKKNDANKTKKKEKEDRPADEEDDKGKHRFKKTGAFTISPAISVSPVDIYEGTITKSSTNQEGPDARAQTMGPGGYKFVQHGLYVAQFDINPHVAHHTLMSELDLKVLAKAMYYAWLLSTSAARPAGSIRPLHIWWKQHTNALGSFNECEFWESLTPKNITGETAGLKDYEIPNPPQKDGLIDLVTTSGVI